MTLNLPSSRQKDRAAISINTKRCLILSDMHVPYHNKTALSSAIMFGRSAGVDSVLLNGDVIDFYQLSKFTKNPRKALVNEEVGDVKQILSEIRKSFSKQQIYYKVGNHEERLQHYAYTNATALVGIIGLELENILELSKFNIRLVDDKRVIKIGKLNVLHGHEYRLVGSAINPARGIFMKSKAATLIGHCHNESKHAEVTLDGKSIGCWSTGCLCDLSPDFAPYNNWNHGFAVVDVDSDGHFTVHNHYISKEGKVY